MQQCCGKGDPNCRCKFAVIAKEVRNQRGLPMTGCKRVQGPEGKRQCQGTKPARANLAGKAPHDAALYLCQLSN